MSIKVVNTNKAPAAIGPYSQAVIANGMLYASGQIPLVPETGEIIDGGVAEQTKQVLDNLRELVVAAGSSLASVVKVTIYITDMQQFATVNQIYDTYFAEPYPARACVQVSALPKGVEVEMDAIVQLD